jgi:hypothetical protein
MTPELLKKMKPYWSVYEASAKGYDDMAKGNSSADGVTLEELEQLFDLKRDSLSENQITDFERVIKTKEVNSYKKAVDFLKSK